MTSTQPQIFLSYVSMLLFNMAFVESQCLSDFSPVFVQAQAISLKSTK